ncbi:MAG: flagellar basal body P-ring formation chaperone FlgA [Comamonadaceae bacterium]
MYLRNCVLAVQLLCGSVAVCQATIEPAQLDQIQTAVELLVQQQSAGLPGKVSLTIGAIDTRLTLAPCPNPEAFMPTGARLWGSTNVGVRCNGSKPWTIYVAIGVKVMADVVVAAHALAQGKTIEPGDLAVQQADLGTLATAVITEPGQALGRIVTLGVAPGQPLRQDLLRSPPVIQQGQSVTLRAQGAGFKVSATGKAVSNAAEGQVAQVRTASGQTVNGIARLGAIVEIQ